MGGLLRGLIWTIVWFAVLGGAAVATGFWLRAQWDKPGPLPQTKAVMVPRGGTAAAAAALKTSGVIENAMAFEALSWLTIFDGSIRAAEFSFPPKATISQVLAILRTAKPVEHRITLIEGLTAKQIAGLLMAAEAASGTVELPPEGAVLPQTYAFDRGMARQAILARAKAAMDRELATVWAARAPNLPLSTPRDLLIVASIVERETAKDQERPHVAAVYLNRLRMGMKLQADPTVAYGASGGSGVLDHKLNRADLDRDDPYNTYKRAGLPPGPICSPGVASLRAVSRPMNSDDLYFVADGSGGHAFAKTVEAHNRNVARWRGLSPAVEPEPAATGR
ncbi:MAG: endolytic transglycosylase MltG [Acetobacteraceae bacterium]|nr:endolytic transglycosylase MltG [Acetobacteraceae bacterium]